jgi:hypothetical protein
MARGDWVRTYAGAIAQGALNVIRGVFGAGGSIGRAAELLQERFGRLPQHIANILAINEFGKLEKRRLERQTRAVLAPPAPHVEHDPTIPSTYRYLVEAVAVHLDGEHVAFSSHWFDSPVEQTLTELQERMAGWLAPLFASEQQKYPGMFDPMEEAVEIEYRIARTQTRG